MAWESPEQPGDWRRVLRRCRDGHEAVWWAADLRLAGWGPDYPARLVVGSTDPARLPEASTWYLETNLPRPEGPVAALAPFAPADLAAVVRLYGLRHWGAQSYQHVKHELGWADFQVRADRAIRRHWQLVCCAFSCCWWAFVRQDSDEQALAHRLLHAAPGLPASAPAGEQHAMAAATVAGRTWATGGRARREHPSEPASALLAAGAARGAQLARPVGHALSGWVVKVRRMC